MNSFVYSIVAIVAVTIIAAVVFAGLDWSSADVFQIKDNVRL